MSNRHECGSDSCESLADVAVIVLSRNRLAEVSENIPFLCKASERTGFQLVVVDNGSQDGSPGYLARMAEQHSCLQVILKEVNTGVAGGRNWGRTVVDRPYVLHIDDDTRIQVSQIRRLKEVLAEHPNAGAVSPRMVHLESGRPQNNHGPDRCAVGNYHGACHMLLARAMEEAGPIDPACVFGGEELDYSIKLRMCGYEVLFEPAVTVLHNNFVRADSEDQWRRKMRVYNLTRLHWKYFSFSQAALFSVRYTVAQLLSGRRKHGFGFTMPLLLTWAKGVRAGLQGRQRVPKHVCAFYGDPALEPDIGNVPLLRKAAKFLTRQPR